MDQFGEDTLTQLAFTIQANKNVYALLLGSGISSSSGIKTGWGITCDLIARYAIGRGEKEPDLESEKDRDDYWATWYTQKYGTEPDYSDILEKLGNTDNERQALVESYIEPTDKEFKKGLKSPTKAHHAIAKLIKSGFIKIIITTNFDRLLEQALNNVGITPTIIASEDDLSGQEPLDHSLCYIIKLHGDYQDRRIKNTTGELSEYSDEYKALLKRIFNDYGLIICGWSAAWDIALKQALRSATSRRYSLFWASYGELGEDANQIVKERKGKVIPTNKIDGADGFFTKLQEKVEQIEKLSLRRPRTEALILATLKDYLSEPEKNRIKIDDLFKEVLTTQLLEFPEFHKDDWVSRSWEDKFKICEVQTQTLAKMIGILGIYGTEGEKEIEFICSILQMICDHLRNKPKYTPYCDGEDSNLAYPAYLIFVIYSLSLTERKRWKDLHKLLNYPLEMYHLCPGNSIKKLAIPLWETFAYYRFENDKNFHCNKEKSQEHFYQNYLIKTWIKSIVFSSSQIDYLINLFHFLCLLISIEEKSQQEIDKVLQSKTQYSLFGYYGQLTCLSKPTLITKNPSIKKIKQDFSTASFKNDLSQAGFVLAKNTQVLDIIWNALDVDEFIEHYSQQKKG